MAEYIDYLQNWAESVDIDSVKILLSSNIRAILCTGVCAVSLWWMFRKPQGIPPGPRWTLPVVGDLLSINQKSDDGDIRLAFRRLRKQHGDIYSVYMGNKLSIFVNGYDNIHDLLVKNGDLFSDRPLIFSYGQLTKYKG